jgi:hypothetical protein
MENRGRVISFFPISRKESEAKIASFSLSGLTQQKSKQSHGVF